MIEFWKNNLSQDQLKKVKFIEYEEVIKNYSNFKKSILDFCEIDIKKSINREKFYSNTASMNQVRSEITDKSLKKEDFVDYKDQFESDLQDQLIYWKNKV